MKLEGLIFNESKIQWKLWNNNNIPKESKSIESKTKAFSPCSSAYTRLSTVTWFSSVSSRRSAATPWHTFLTRPSRAWCSSATGPATCLPTGPTFWTFSSKPQREASSSSPSHNVFRVSKSLDQGQNKFQRSKLRKFFRCQVSLSVRSGSLSIIKG